jgi:SPP1 gp7 family putative phage head morphogenesis protein
LYADNIPKYNPDTLIGRKGHGIYRQMMQDEQVKAVVKFKRDAITGRDFKIVWPEIEGDEVKPGKDEQTRVEIYEEMIRSTYGSFVDGMNFILMAMYQGFSMTEKVIDTFEYNGRPYLGVQELVPKPFDTFEFEIDEYGSIIKTVQRVDNQVQTIDLNRFVYYVQNPEFDQHYGQSDLREAYRSWYSKDVVIRFYNQFLERFAGGFAVGKPTSGGVLTPGTPEFNSMIAAMDSIQTQTSILLPNNIDLTIEKPNTTDQFERAIGMYDLGIAKALLVPNLLGITPQAAKQGGGFAQANTQLEAFLWTLDADATRLEETINEQIFIPLSKLNFPDGRGPLFKFKSISEAKKMEMIKTWQELVTAGAVEASDTDEHHLRELLNFPRKGEPLELTPEIGLPNEIPPQARDRGPVKEPNQQRTNNSAAFQRAEKRVAFNVIERKAGAIENESAILLEDKIADMVAQMAARIQSEKLGTPAAEFDGIASLDFNPRQKAKARKAVDSMLHASWALGQQHSSTELATARKEQFKINMARIGEAVDEFLKVKGFQIFGKLNDDMRAIVQNILLNGVKFSWTSDEITNKVYDELTTAGFIAVGTNAAATGRTVEAITETLGGPFSLGRLTTAIRTASFEAINEARFNMFTDPALDGFVEALEYSAILDSRTTRVCRHLDERVYEADDVIWDKYRPPNHFNCRSILVPVTIIDTDVEGKDAAAGSRFSRPPTVEPQQGFGA